MSENCLDLADLSSFKEFLCKKNEDGNTIIHELTRTNEIELLEKIIQKLQDLQCNTDDIREVFDVPDEGEETCVHVAVSFGHLDILQKLVQVGANLEARDWRQCTPLHVATNAGYPEVLEYLVNKGVDVNARDDSGATALHRAVFRGHLGNVKLLLSHGANPRLIDANGFECLRLAKQYNFKPIVELLEPNMEAQAGDSTIQ